MASAASEGKLKILLVGPQKVGKTTVANFLSEHSENLGAGDEYKPTAALRIVEFERELTQDGPWGGSKRVSVQLWDVSGDQAYESCWPAIQKGADGAVFMYNPDNRGQEKEIEIWYEYFAQHIGLEEDQCLVFAHRAAPGQKPRPPKSMARVHSQATSFESPGLIRMEFDKWLASIAAIAERGDD